MKVFHKRLELKFIGLVSITLFLSFGAIVYVVSTKQREDLLNKEREKSVLIADVVHQTLDKDMMAFRADLVRHLINDIKGMPGIIRLQVVRGDGGYLGDGRGREEAFQDFKTLEDVRARIQTLYKKEWESNHPVQTVMADGSEDSRFRDYFDSVILELSKPGVLANQEVEIRDEGKLDHSYMEEIKGREAMTYLRPLPNFPKCALCHGAEHKLRGILMITTSMDEVRADVAKSQGLLLMVSGITMVSLIFLLRGLIKRLVLVPLNLVTERIRDIAQGGGDLTQRIQLNYQDEIGNVANWVNVFMEKLQHIVYQVSQSSKQVGNATQEVSMATKSILEGLKDQMEGVISTSSSSEEMKNSIEEIAKRTEALSDLADESASAVLEMSSSIEEIAKSSAVLSSYVDTTSSSIQDMSSSIKQIDSSVKSLSTLVNDTADSMVTMDRSIQQVQSNVRDTVKLSQGVVKEAGLGQAAVDQTARWIYQTEQNSHQMEEVILGLNAKTDNIGKILGVIDNVARQTNLLALNAAIIAAQSGEHGKGFSVVAQEIKDLANRTSISTREIQEIIKELQEGSQSASAAIRLGTKSVEEGVRLSKEATEALNRIMDSSNQSTVRIEQIAATTDEQLGGVKRVTQAMISVNEAVQQINSSSHEQFVRTENIIKTTEQVRDIANHLKTSMGEQTKTNKHINESIERVNRMGKDIAEATGRQTIDSNQIFNAIERIRKVIQKNEQVIGKVDSAVEKLLTQASTLFSEIDKFKL